MHWCYQESEALAMSLPVIGVAARKVYVWRHKVIHGKSHDHQHCTAAHQAVPCPLPSELAQYPHGKVNEGLCPQHFTHSDCPSLTVQEVDHLYGEIATIKLQFDRQLLCTESYPKLVEFHWYRQDDGVLLAQWQGKSFLYINDEWLEELTDEDILQ
jgi:hypothetical protein